MAQKKLVIFVAIAVIALVFLPSIAKLQKLRYRDAVLKNRIKTLQKQNIALSGEKYKLENDAVYLEGVARQDMGVTRKGEIIYKIVPQQTQQKADER